MDKTNNAALPMRKILVIGSGGAGKSTFAARLGSLTGLPVIHLDAHFWKPGWVEPSQEEWDKTVAGLISGEAWIMDGNYGRTLETRLAACDTVIFLDRPRLLCLARVVWRRIRFSGQVRPDMGQDCPEHLDWEFIRWIWNFPATHRPKILQRLADLPPGQRAIVLRTRADIDTFFRSLPDPK